MSEKFQDVQGFKDKKSNISAHAASYLTDISFDLEVIYSLFKIKKKYFTAKKDLDLLEEIEHELRKGDFFYITPHEKFFISKNLNDEKLILSYLIFRYRFK